ncbi:sulfatase [Photobacterium rosenbergii]|uniref:Sulfatase n=2 Tax=Photobacterium rosenbergii TaxID=294936 RepID=A0A2T3NMC1_9GAMM|nr:sulfatase [Photobacterium rosenbergii]
MVTMKKNVLTTAMLMLFSATAALSLAAEPAKSEQTAPNILLITADDMDYGSLGVTGSTVPEISPNLDRLANQGIRFNNAFVTVSVCEPSRGVMATGRYIQNSGIWGFYPTTQNIPTLAEELKDGGYTVGILGKVNHSTPKYVDDYVWDYSKDKADIGSGRGPKLYRKHLEAFIDSAQANDKPFFMMANSHDPHRPYFVDSPNYERGGKQRPSRIYKPEEIQVPSFLPDIPGARKELAQYYSSVKRLDDTVGEMMSVLEEKGVSDNTIVLFLSDNGIAAPFAKSNVYRNSNHTPFFVRWPEKINASVDDEHFVSMVDLMPTLLEAADLEVPDSLDGRSFLPVLKGESQAERDYVFTQYHENAGGRIFPMAAVQNSDWLYIFNPWAVGGRVYKTSANNSGTFKAMKKLADENPEIKERVEFFLNRTVTEFYDLRKDPDAKVNLADKKEFKEQQMKMVELMRQHMEQYNDPMLELLLKRDDNDFLVSRTAELQMETRERKKIHRQLSGGKKGH